MISWPYCLRALLLLSVWLMLEGKSSIAHADGISVLEQQVYDLINSHRRSIGLNPLNYSEEIADVARRHSRNMANGYVGMGHEGVEERRRVLLRTIGYTEFAENVAANSLAASSTVQTAVTGWLNSPGHRTNLEGNFDLTGVGVAHSGNSFFFTQIFLTTRSSSRLPVEARRPREHPPARSYSSDDEDRPPSRNRRAYAPSDEEEDDPRKRPGRTRVRGGYVQNPEDIH